METPFKPPHVARRRDGDNRIVREVDDIIALIQYLDENKLLCSLPIYVSANSDCMPSARLFEGELNMLIVMFQKMGHKVDEFGSALAATTRDEGTLQSKCFMSLEQFPPLPAPAAPVSREQRSRPQPQQPCELPVKGNSTRSTTNNTGDQLTDGRVRSDAWSVLASTPQRSKNRFAVLASTDDDDHRDGDQPYTVVHAVTRGALSGETTTTTVSCSKRLSATTASRSSRAKENYRKIGYCITGCVYAAKKTITKAVFCVDNVDLTRKEDDIRAHISSLRVDVFSCFKMKPRRRPHEAPEDVLDRKAFRVCVNSADRDRLLNPDS